MEPTRKFKIIINSKECGTFSGPTPSAVAKKVVKKLCGKSNKTVKFSLKECKRGCEKVCGPYQGRMEKLDRPYKRGGKTITHRVVCGKVQKMRGGELGQDGENLTMDDFEVEVQDRDRDVPFLKEYRDTNTKEQYIFFNPISFEENIEEMNENKLSQLTTNIGNNNSNNSKLYYEYVVIRTKDVGTIFKTRSVYFKKLDKDTQPPFPVEQTDINLKILEKLSDELNKKIKNNSLIAETIQKELKKILKSRINDLNRQNNSNNKRNNSDFKNSFKISNNSPKKIFVLEKRGRTSKLFGNKKQYIFFHMVESNNTQFYQYVVIRDENQEITFKDFQLNEVNIINIPEDILLELLNDINDYRQTVHNKNFATSIMKKLREYLHYNNKNLNRYFRVPTSLSPENMYDDYFYIKTIKKEKRYYIAFKPVNNRSHQSVEYEYMVIIDESNGIIFMKKETANGSSHIHKISINDIPIDILYDLYSQLSETRVDNIDILNKFLKELNFTNDYRKYKEWVESILKNPIKKTRSGNKITNLKQQNHDIEYFGKFSFDFISEYNPELNNIQSEILKQWLETILEKQQIKQGKKQNTYIFKPKIKSIKSSINNYNRERIVV